MFNLILIAGLSILLCSEVYFGIKIHALSAEQEQIKEDYSLSNNVTFGLFSIDQWRDRIAAILNSQVQDFSLTRKQKRELQAAVEKQLHSLVDKTVSEINKPQKSLGGKLKKLAFNAIVDSADIQRQVRPFAKTIIDKVSSPASQDRLKNIAASKVGQLEKQTYDSTSTAIYQVTRHLYQKYRVSNSTEFNQQISNRLKVISRATISCAMGMLASVIVALLLWWIMRKQVHLQTTLFIMSLLFASVLLAVGLTASIIEVDARIKTLDLMMLGDKVSFQNQVLFFQSKSIWQVVHTLIMQQKPDAIVVGSLILLFVIILPVVRLLAAGIHLLSPKNVAENKAVTYLAFESNKWDMADVMIVGILMTYIGLNGILKSQLSNLNVHTNVLITETSNGTSLQPGYFIFAGYVLFAMLLSYILKRITPHQHE